MLSLTIDEEISSVYLPVYQKVETRRHYEGEVGYVGQQLEHLIVMMMMIILTFVHLVMLLLILQPSEGWLMISDWLSTGRSTYQLVMVGLVMMLMI